MPRDTRTEATLERRADWDGPELIRRANAAGLRGRGGGWFPTGRKWQAVRAEGGRPFVVANGHEGEPGSIKDRHVMATRAGDVVLGLTLAARAVGAREGAIFIKESFAAAAEALQAALDAAPAEGLALRLVRVRGRPTWRARKPPSWKRWRAASPGRGPSRRCPRGWASRDGRPWSRTSKPWRASRTR